MSLFLMGLVACDGKMLGGEDYEIASGELAGRIDGVDWAPAVGETQVDLGDADTWLATLWSEDLEACSRDLPTGDGLVFDAPMAAGEYELGPELSVTFVYGESLANVVSTTGLLEIEEVGADRVSGGLYAIYAADPDFEVSGRFVLEICAE